MLLQRAEVRPSQRLGRYPDYERGLVEGCNCETSAIDAYAVAEVRIGEDIGAVRDGEGCASTAGGGVILGLNGGDGWTVVRLLNDRRGNVGKEEVLPTVSTMPVNILPVEVELSVSNLSTEVEVSYGQRWRGCWTSVVGLDI